MTNLSADCTDVDSRILAMPPRSCCVRRSNHLWHTFVKIVHIFTLLQATISVTGNDVPVTTTCGHCNSPMVTMISVTISEATPDVAMCKSNVCGWQWVQILNQMCLLLPQWTEVSAIYTGLVCSARTNFKQPPQIIERQIWPILSSLALSI